MIVNLGEFGTKNPLARMESTPSPEVAPEYVPKLAPSASLFLVTVLASCQPPRMWPTSWPKLKVPSAYCMQTHVLAKILGGILLIWISLDFLGQCLQEWEGLPHPSTGQSGHRRSICSVFFSVPTKHGNYQVWFYKCPLYDKQHCDVRWSQQFIHCWLGGFERLEHGYSVVHFSAIVGLWNTGEKVLFFFSQFSKWCTWTQWTLSSTLTWLFLKPRLVRNRISLTLQKSNEIRKTWQRKWFELYWSHLSPNVWSLLCIFFGVVDVNRNVSHCFVSFGPVNFLQNTKDLIMFN